MFVSRSISGVLALAFFALISNSTPARAQDVAFAKIATSMGDIYVELDRKNAPNTVENFLNYATTGHYDRTLWHRVVPGFVIQGGGYGRGFIRRPDGDPIANEADNGVKNLRGTLAMARGDDPHSIRAQFYINLKHNEELDFKYKAGPGWGHPVFGRVIQGMEVVDAIAAVKTEPGGPFSADAPVEDVLILRIDPIAAPPPMPKSP